MANWNDLPNELKWMIVEEMTFETRTRLKICSKSDKNLVETIPIYYDVLLIRSRKTDSMTDICISLQTSKTSKLDFLLFAYVLTDGPLAGWVGVIVNNGTIDERVKRIRCSSSEEGENLITQLFENIVFNRNLSFYCINIDKTYPGFLADREFTIRPKYANIKGESGQVTGWLRKMAPGVEAVVLEKEEEGNNGKIEGLGTISVVMNATILDIDRECDVNDEQLVNFNGKIVRFRGKSNITGKGVNQLIKKAIANDYPKGSFFEVALNEVVLQTWDDIIEGLDVKVSEEEENSDEEGEEEEVELIEKKGSIEMRRGKRMEVELRMDNVIITICKD